MTCGYVQPQLVFSLYYGSYAALTFLLALCLLLGQGHGGGGAALRGFAASPTGARLRVPLLGVLGALAGLPPFFFFLPKLGLAAALLGGGHWGTVLGAFLCILLGWYVYFGAASRLLYAALAWPMHPLRRQRLWVPALPLLSIGALLLGLGGFVFDDAVLAARWLLS